MLISDDKKKGNNAAPTDILLLTVLFFMFMIFAVGFYALIEENKNEVLLMEAKVMSACLEKNTAEQCRELLK